MKKKILYSAMLLLGSLALTNCTKDESMVSLNVSISPYQGNGKTYIDSERYTCWSDGDQVKINGQVRTVEIDGNNCSISNIHSSSDGYVALYPASIATSSTTMASTQISNLSIPATQSFETDGNGNQRIPTIMTGYLATSTGTIDFYNASMVLKLNIRNNYHKALNINSIRISDNEAPLNGTFGITNLSNNTPTLSFSGETVTDENKAVTLEFDESITLNTNDESSYYVVLPPTSEYTNNKFTVQVLATLDNSYDVVALYEFSHTQSSSASGAIGRNQLVPININLDDPHTLVLNGLGTVNTPYKIATVDDLDAMSYLIQMGYKPVGNGTHFSSAYYQMAADINASNKTLYPIGVERNNFTGVFDGNGKTISNLECYEGLFGYISNGAVIKDLTVNNAEIETSSSCSGVICAHADRSTIDHCRILGDVNFYIDQIDACYIGGIVGDAVAEISSNCIIRNCHNGAAITLNSSNAGTRLGGIVGHTKNANIQNCYTRKNTTTSTSSVLSAANAFIGGIVGRTDGASSIFNCYFGLYDNINGTSGRYADICGDKSTATYIQYCYYRDKIFAAGTYDDATVHMNSRYSTSDGYMFSNTHLGTKLNSAASTQTALLSWTIPSSGTESPEILF